jgi:hypothetical protein
MHITTYKKQGAPDHCSIHHLLLSTRASSCTKSKGLLIDASYRFYYFQHTHRRVQKVRDSIGMCSIFSIWLIKFSKSFCSSADIIIDSLARLLTPRACLLVLIRMQGIRHVGLDRLISFIGWQRINRLHIMMEELVREDPSPTISTRIRDSRTWYIWSIYNYKHPEEAKTISDWLLNRITSRRKE